MIDTAAPRRTTAGEPWRPTAAFLRGALVAIATILVALLARRPDLLVVGAPFAIITAWSTLVRPGRPPTVSDRFGNAVLREGDAMTWRGRIEEIGGVDTIAAYLVPGAWTEVWPSGGGVCVDADRHEQVEVRMQIRSTRWGRRTVDPATVVASSAFGAFQSVMTTSHTSIVTLPRPAVFDAAAPVRTTEGLVGLARAARVGEGGEFSSLRPFAVGDRMRRINWPRSLRADTLQVNATWADQDTHVAFIVDASDDFGRSEGIDGLASSLDTTVRAIGAIAEHHIRRGDRVSVRTFGTVSQIVVPPASGQAQLRRVLDTLSRIRPANTGMNIRRQRGRTLPVTGAALTVMLSPLVTRDALDRAVELGRHGLPVVVIDTLPARLTAEGDAYTRLAWRIRLLDRRREIRRVQHAGIPVVAWHGPGSLDQFLRDAARRANAPRLRVG